MLRKNEGFFLADMLLSLAALMMATSFLLPYAVMVAIQIKEDRMDAEAVELLFDELMYIKMTGIESSRTMIVKNRSTYHLVVNKDTSEPWEVCVQYEENEKQHEICEFAE